jgi:predicted PhzF superfamily epimerase YddE/YHI9
MPPFALVDAFTAVPFAGNPAGVVVLDAPADAGWMAAVAAEVRASETAFVHPEGSGWGLRWFTPTVEVDLCGHATLAAAHTLWRTGVADGPLRFATRSGALHATRGVSGEVSLDLPSWPIERTGPAPDALSTALPGVAHRYLGRTGGAQPNDVAEVDDEVTLRGLRPDLTAVLALGSTGLIVTAPGGDGTDLVSRYFAPAVGVDEDPVTGSAHSTLGPLWAARLGRDRLTARQVSPRGGALTVHVRGDRVEVGGQAVTVVEGTIASPSASASPSPSA